MPHIEELLRDLKSKKGATRYGACEELRIAPSIPDVAIQALRIAAADPDPDVADAATRALKIHAPISAPGSYQAPVVSTPIALPIPPTPTSPSLRPRSRTIWLLSPGICLVACWAVSFVLIEGRRSLDTYAPLMVRCAPAWIVAGAASGALAYYGALAARSGSTPRAIALGNFAIALGVLLFMALLALTYLAAGLWVTG